MVVGLMAALAEGLNSNVEIQNGSINSDLRLGKMNVSGSISLTGDQLFNYDLNWKGRGLVNIEFSKACVQAGGGGGMSEGYQGPILYLSDDGGLVTIQRGTEFNQIGHCSGPEQSP